jgi:hypothetical protein
MITYPNGNWGLNASKKFYGYCRCLDTANNGFDLAPGNYFTGCVLDAPSSLIRADHECTQGVAIAGYAPAVCYFDGTTSQTNPASACLNTTGVSVYKMVAMNGSTGVTNGCYTGCEYNPPAAPSMVVVGGVSYAAGMFNGTGRACLPGANQLLDVPSGTAMAATFATEGTQLANKSLLEQIRDKIGTSSSSGGGGSTSAGTNTGGDLERTAVAVESVASAVMPSNSASAAAVQAEGEAAMAKNVTAAEVADSLPQETVNFGEALSGVTVSVFGAGSCPAPMQITTWNNQPVNFSFDIICQFATAISFLVVAAASFKGFQIAMKD